MPPIRTPTIKPVKTERTHEENQERAYIAASRRSDRSLEARIESARRASEIHKKRTGRALRVTEQDVVNEEMYEEEDDDLPAQYRRLQSHLQTGSYEFNRRLQAYMTSQIGMRNALIEQGNFAGPYPNGPFFTNQFGQPQQPTMMNPQMLHYPSTQGFSRFPYASPAQGFPGLHNRSASISTPQDFANYMQAYPNPTTPQFSPEELQRRMSLPMQAVQSGQPQPAAQATARPPVSRSMSSTSVPDVSGASPELPQAGSSPQAKRTISTTSTVVSDANTQAQTTSFAPLTPSLPPETQQLLGQPPMMDNSSSFNPYWSTGMSQPFYSYKPNSSSSGSSPTAKTTTAANQTLSLNPLDTSVHGHSPSQGYITSANADGMTTPFSGAMSNDFFSADSFFTDSATDPTMTRSSSGHASGSVTPGGNDWTHFLQPFDDSTTT